MVLPTTQKNSCYFTALVCCKNCQSWNSREGNFFIQIPRAKIKTKNTCHGLNSKVKKGLFRLLHANWFQLGEYSACSVEWLYEIQADYTTIKIQNINDT